MYGLWTLIGILLWGFFSVYKARKDGLSDFHTIAALLLCGAGGFLGSHLLYAITNLRYLYGVILHPELIKNFDDFTELLALLFGGGVFYGGMLMAVAVCIIYLKASRLDKPAYTDAIVLGLPLFHAFARVGCFFAGCCYGIEVEHGVHFPIDSIPGEGGVARLPVQLIESGVNLLVFLVLWYFYNHRDRFCVLRGRILQLYLAIYAVERFILEYFRGDEIRGKFWIFSTSQWISIIVLVCVIISTAVGLSRRRKANSGV